MNIEQSHSSLAGEDVKECYMSSEAVLVVGGVTWVAALHGLETGDLTQRHISSASTIAAAAAAEPCQPRTHGTPEPWPVLVTSYQHTPVRGDRTSWPRRWRQHQVREDFRDCKPSYEPISSSTAYSCCCVRHPRIREAFI